MGGHTPDKNNVPYGFPGKTIADFEPDVPNY
jgi:hypothetical protein